MEKDKHIGLRVDTETHGKLKSLSEFEGRSINGEILYLIRGTEMYWMYMNFHITHIALLYAWMKNHISFWAMQGNHCQWALETMGELILNKSEMAHAAYSHS